MRSNVHRVKPVPELCRTAMNDSALMSDGQGIGYLLSDFKSLI
jgi:hypothetical protein